MVAYPTNIKIGGQGGGYKEDEREVGRQRSRRSLANVQTSSSASAWIDTIPYIKAQPEAFKRVNNYQLTCLINAVEEKNQTSGEARINK